MAVHIIGGGIIGLCSAYYLNSLGEEVTIIDKSELTTGCSHGNAGMIVPSHFIPLAAPGVINKGLRWMFKPSSPFFIRSIMDKDLLQWLWKFYKSCNLQNVEQSMALLYDANNHSVSLYSELTELLKGKTDQSSISNFKFQRRGLLLLYRDEKTRKEELETAEVATTLGLEAIELNEEEIKALNPGCVIVAMGGIYYPGDAHIDPAMFMGQMIQYLRAKGVKFILSEEIIGFRQSLDRIETITTNKQEIKVDDVLIAAGSWSGKLMKFINRRLLIQDGKGYSMSFSGFSNTPAIPTILAAEKVSISPYKSAFRLGGTLEISRLSNKIDIKRLDGILNSFSQYFPDIPVERPQLSEVWYGFRPLSPDGLPYIGRISGFQNCFINSGHAMLGMSLGPISGLLISQIMTNTKTSIPVHLFNPGRF